MTWLLISTGAAEIVLFFAALAGGLPLPLHAVQILWLNLVTNGVQDVALALEAGEPGVLDRPPHPPERPIFDRLMAAETAVTGAWMGAIAFVVYYLLLVHGRFSQTDARTHVLLLMVLFENAHVFNCRSETRSAFRVPLRRNITLVATVVVAQLVHLGAAYVAGLRDVLDVRPVSVEAWLVLVPVAATVIFVSEIQKHVRRIRARGVPWRRDRVSARRRSNDEPGSEFGDVRPSLR